MSKRVLVADDSMLMRRIIGDTLALADWELAGEAVDGREAVELYRQLRPDAVTLDIVMPDMGGLAALENILRFDADAKVVVISALNQTKLISEAIRKGAQDFLVKPFMPEQLQETLEEGLAGSVRSPGFSRQRS